MAHGGAHTKSHILAVRHDVAAFYHLPVLLCKDPCLVGSWTCPESLSLIVVPAVARIRATADIYRALALSQALLPVHVILG